MYCIVQWEIDQKYSLKTLKSILKPRKQEEDYEEGDLVILKWGKQDLEATIITISGKFHFLYVENQACSILSFLLKMCYNWHTTL